MKKGKPFEIIFVSLDRSQESFDEYLAEMPWVAIPFGHESSNGLKGRYGVEGEKHSIVEAIHDSGLCE